MNRGGVLFAAIAAITFVWAASNVDAGTYVEDFTTTTYKDASQTSAWWDTALGELKLYPFAPGLVGSYNTTGQSLGLYVTGDFAYVADGTHGLHIISIANPAAPVLLGSYNTGGDARDVDVAGYLGYVADGANGLQIINIANPASPGLLGGFAPGDQAWDVCVSGDHVFMADGTSGLRVITAYDPIFPPTLVGQYNTSGTAYGVCVRGDLAFVADGASGLQVIDISNLASPSLAGTYDTPGLATEIFVDGNYAFVADGGSGLQIIDISDPTNPALVGTYDTPGNAWDVRVTGDLAYIADYNHTLQIVDVSNPASPVLAGSYDGGLLANGVWVDGTRVFIADYSNGMLVIDATQLLLPPVVVGSYSFSGEARGVILEGNHAFVAGDVFGGLQIIDVTDPATPVLKGMYNTTGEAMDVDVAGDYAYVAGYNAGLQVLDISNLSAPVLMGTYNTINNAMGVEVWGNYAYIADYGGGLRVIDVSNPSTPTLTGFYDTPGLAYDLDVEGNFAFVADADDGVQIIGIATQSSPVLVGTYNTPGDAIGVCVAGEYCYVADHAAGLVVLDISNPSAPSLLGSYNTSGFARDVTVLGDYAFVADWMGGLKVIDISDPSSPTLADSVYTGGNTRDVRVAGDYAFTASGSLGLKVARVFQSDYDQNGNRGWSHAVSPSGQTILKVSATTTQTGTVTWELGANPGVVWYWQSIQPNGSWNTLFVPGTDLMWRSTHQWAQGTNSAVSQLQIDWLTAAAASQSIMDVPGDQGGWVRANFTRSGYDFIDESEPIEDYGIWRRQDDPALVAELRGLAPTGKIVRASNGAPLMGGVPLVSWQGRTFVDSRVAQGAAASFPPGTWEWVATVPALQQDDYVAVLPTAADSSASGTPYTVLVITAHTTTPSVWYASAPDSGYSVDNIAPTAPTNFAVAYNTGGGNLLSWDPCPDDDFHYFNVYRSTDPTFEPALDNLVHSTTGTIWTDPDYDGWNMAYKITAVDDADNESDATGAGSVSGSGDGLTPQWYSLHQNEPNPFNPATVIRYDVPEGGGNVSLQVFDVSGRLVRTLVDGVQTSGHKQIGWNGLDESGRPVSSGLYFYRLTAGDFSQTKKMLLLK